LAECFQGGRVLPPETVRDHHKKFDRIMQGRGAEAEQARRLLNAARKRREAWGWDTSTWLLVLDLSEVQALGYEVKITAK
jgi:hypothetical protein